MTSDSDHCGSERDRIAAALTRIIRDSGLSHQEIADELGTAKNNVDRWATGLALCSRDMVAAIEKICGVELGTADELAGYVKKPTTVRQAIEQASELNNGYRRIVLAVYDEGVAGTQEEREVERPRRKIASTQRRARRS